MRPAIIMVAGVAALACEPAPAPAPPDAAASEAIACRPYATTAEVEAQIIVPRCGRPGDTLCHVAGPYPPKMGQVGAIAANVLDHSPTRNCRQDRLVDRQDPARSFFLAKVFTRGEKAACADGGDGGPRMPYADAPSLTAEEAACLRWWVYEIGK
jgi:hypothetical protein